MCGIAGELRFDGKPADLSALQGVTAQMTPRGPDAAGLNVQGHAALGHRRLKIIDLTEAAQQPMVDSELGLSVVFNGCIYNHKELRAELEGKGVSLLLGMATPRSCSRAIMPGARISFIA